MKIERRTFLTGAAALAGAGAVSMPRLSAQGTSKIRFLGAAAVARPDQGFMFLGIPTGFYKALSIDADFMTIAGSAAVIQLLTSGAADVGHVGMMELLAAKQRSPRLPVKAVYLQEWGSGYEIVLPSTSPLREVKDLAGKRIGVLSLASGAVPMVQAMLRHAGVDPGKVELLPVGAGAPALAALRSNQVDALSLFRGSHAALESMGIQLRYLTVSLPSSVLAVNEEMLAKNPGVIVRALQGVVQNTAYIETNSSAAVKRYWDVFGKPGGDEAKALRENALLVQRSAELWKQISNPRPWGDMNDTTWLDLIDYMGAEGGIKLGKGDLSQVYSNELIAEVNKVDIGPAVEAARKA